VFQVLNGVPQGSILGPLIFILYTTPIITVISNSSANHNLYADYRYTQPFLSSSAADVAYNISRLKHTISNVYNWMSSNFLSVNPFKTEFLLVGFPQQLSKLSNPIIHLPNNITLSPVHSAPNLGVIFDSNLACCERNSAGSKSCFYHIRQGRNCIL
jgi:Reverse transcriptase (RNA-dependent DNA polymerase)